MLVFFFRYSEDIFNLMHIHEENVVLWHAEWKDNINRRKNTWKYLEDKY